MDRQKGTPDLQKMQRLIRVAAGGEKADVVLKNAAWVNVFTREICRGDIALAGEYIAGVGCYEGAQEIDLSGKTVIPGLIDAHIHLESAMVTPWEFARAAVPHGTAMVVADPHEIVNVMGEKGMRLMQQAARGLPMEVRFMAPSCVPATPMEDGAACLNARDVERILHLEQVDGLGEVMDYLSVCAGEADVLQKILAARQMGLRADGHAPGLTGKALNAYTAAGVASDHECTTREEALGKMRLGQYVMIRQGSAARDLKALAPLLSAPWGDRCLLCCDDRHPGDLIREGHMDENLRLAVRWGADPIEAVKAASYNAARYLGLHDRGAIAPGRLADLVAVDDLENFTVDTVWHRGRRVYAEGRLADFDPPRVDPALMDAALHTFRVPPLRGEDFALSGPAALMGVMEGEIVTQNLGTARGVDTEQDILKIAVIERHKGAGRIGLGYIKGYGLKAGAVAASVCHDAHNLIVVGASDEEMALAANDAASRQGGLAVVKKKEVLARVDLPIGGLMSRLTLGETEEQLLAALEAARALGVGETVDPFMTLSFMALSVIPQVCITTRGMFDVAHQRLI